MSLNDDLRAEYLLIQGQYEAYDQRALSLKALATPLLGAGIAIGLKDPSGAILVATLLVALSLWMLEAIWKSFQYCLKARIEALEAWYRSDQQADLKPFQIYTSWGESWRERYRRPGEVLGIIWLPFVFLPYLPIALFGLAGSLWAFCR